MLHDSAKLHTEEDKDEDKEDEEDDSDNGSDSDDEEDEEKKAYLWPAHSEPKASKDGKFKYLYSSEGKKYAVATPQNLANEAQKEKQQKPDYLGYELQKQLDAKLQQEHIRLKHEGEVKFNASKPEKDECITGQ
ncbi:hypothetical protein FGADI_3629 [Fusarium gaditjirri]|uniref:Uncharacterized protein n=1 Tax=Fusarium gaditjirri TaxID=282569 RepID=A0A8H4X0H3_9HYPO|nr:hypothetical protein FGADI_3629 [Fusarium gaditjirri]